MHLNIWRLETDGGKYASRGLLGLGTVQCCGSQSRKTRVYPKVSGLAVWSEKCKRYSSPPLGAFYRYVVSQSSEFCSNDPLYCFSTISTKGKRIFRYQLSPEILG